jgi:hypothetical protein
MTRNVRVHPKWDEKNRRKNKQGKKFKSIIFRGTGISQF